MTFDNWNPLENDGKCFLFQLLFCEYFVDSDSPSQLPKPSRPNYETVRQVKTHIEFVRRVENTAKE